MGVVAILATGCLEQRVVGLGWTLGDLTEEKTRQLWVQTESFHDTMYHPAIARPAAATRRRLLPNGLPQQHHLTFFLNSSHQPLEVTPWRSLRTAAWAR